MALKTEAGSVRLRMPSYYGVCVLAGTCGFAIMLAALLALYGWLTWSGISAFLHMRFGREPVTVQGAVLRIVLGLLFFILTWRSLRGSEEWKRIEVTKGSCPPLEALLAGCAARAGVAPPDAVYLTPDGNIAAFSSGVVRGSGQQSNFINIGAMLLPGLNSGELEAALFHEFAHLVMRRDQWTVKLDTRIREFVPRLRLINRRGVKGFFIAVTAGRVLLLWYWNLYNLLMAPLRRHEELLADDFAAACCGKTEYARRLAVILVLQRTFENGLEDSVNGLFHAALLGMPEDLPAEQYPNWFEIAGDQFREPILAKLGEALEYLRDSEQQKLLDEHPTLRTRLGRLGQDMPASVQELVGDEEGITTDPAWQRQISADFAKRLRPDFFEAKQRAGLAVDLGFTPDSVACYGCRFASCPVYGKTHLALSRSGLRWTYTDGTVNDVPWSDLASVEVLPSGKPSGRDGPWISAVFAMYWGLPSLAEVELVWPGDAKGMVSRRTLQIFHLRENMQEVMDLTKALWAHSRSVVMASNRGMPILLRELKSNLLAEAAPTAQPDLIARQASLIQEAYRCNAGQMRWQEFAQLLQLYETLMKRAAEASEWAGSVKGRGIVLEQLNKRQDLRAQIARMGWSFLGRLLWVPLWVRIAAIAGTFVLFADALYAGVAWHHQAALRFIPFTRQLFEIGWFHLSFMVGGILLSMSIAARLSGSSVMESVELTTVRASNTAFNI